MLWVLTPPPAISQESQKNPPGLNRPYAISNCCCIFLHSLGDKYWMLKTLHPTPHSLLQDLAWQFLRLVAGSRVGCAHV